MSLLGIIILLTCKLLGIMIYNGGLDNGRTIKFNNHGFEKE